MPSLISASLTFPDLDVQPRPTGAGVVFDKGFASGSANGSGVLGFFKDHGDWDFYIENTDFDYSFTTGSGGLQRLIIPERDPSVLPGGARIDPNNGPKPNGGDVGIHKTYATGVGDVWQVDAWVLIESVNRLGLHDFKVRVTCHYYDGTQKSEPEQNMVTYLTPTGFQQLTLACPIAETVTDKIRVNVRAHSANRGDTNLDGYQEAAASGTVAVDRFKLELIQRGL